MRYKITLSYDGSGFCGWQIQSGAATVQECLEQALSALLRSPVSVTGAGRTDSGVNAIGYVAHFDLPEATASAPSVTDDIKDVRAMEPALLSYKLNAILPPSIVIHAVTPVPDGFHARFDASQRKYTYFLHRMKDPFVEKYSLRRDWALDFEAMNRAAALLVGRHDFACFQKTGTDVKTSVCTVTEAFWAPYTPTHVSLMGFAPAAPEPTGPASRPQGAGMHPDGECSLQASGGPGPSSACASGGIPRRVTSLPPKAEALPGLDTAGWRYAYFRISADRFLRNMVRAVVGTLLEVGRGKRSVEDFATLILPVSDETAGTPAESLRSRAGDSVPGHALFLSKVDYPAPLPAVQEEVVAHK